MINTGSISFFILLSRMLLLTALLSPSSFVDIPLQRLASITLDNVERELRPVIGFDTEAANITRNLEAVQAVLEDAESRQLKEDTVRLWLNDLTQLCYEMEDVLDENTEVQKDEWRNKKMEVKMASLPRRRKVILYLAKFLKRLLVACCPVPRTSLFWHPFCCIWLLTSEPMDYECKGSSQTFHKLFFLWFTLLSVLDLLSLL